METLFNKGLCTIKHDTIALYIDKKENDTSTGKEGASSKMLSQLERKRIVNEEIIVTQVTPDLI
jgi:hypothetical protein